MPVTAEELAEELAATLAEAHALMQEVADWLDKLQLDNRYSDLCHTERCVLVAKMFHHLTHKAEHLDKADDKSR
jgi:hypothetical protein